MITKSPDDKKYRGGATAKVYVPSADLLIEGEGQVVNQRIPADRGHQRLRAHAAGRVRDGHEVHAGQLHRRISGSASTTRTSGSRRSIASARISTSTGSRRRISEMILTNRIEVHPSRRGRRHVHRRDRDRWTDHGSYVLLQAHYRTPDVVNNAPCMYACRARVVITLATPCAVSSADPPVAEMPPIAGMPPAPAPPPAPGSSALVPRGIPFGYLRVQYIAVQDDPNVPFVGHDDGFELQNARVGVVGLLDRRMAFTVSLDGAVDEADPGQLAAGQSCRSACATRTAMSTLGGNSDGACGVLPVDRRSRVADSGSGARVRRPSDRDPRHARDRGLADARLAPGSFDGCRDPSRSGIRARRGMPVQITKPGDRLRDRGAKRCRRVRVEQRQ